MQASVLQHRDLQGRPIVYIAARKHNAYERDIDRLTKFIVYVLVSNHVLPDIEHFMNSSSFS